MTTEEQRKKRREYMRKWNARNREKVNARTLEYYYKHKKKRIKQVAEYKKANPEKVKQWAAEYRERHASEIAAYNAKNKDKQEIRSRRRYEKNREEILSQQRNAYAKNKKLILARNAAWREANRAHVRKQQMEYKRKRLSSDPVFRFIENARRRILNALRGIGSKSARTVELLGCTGEEACAYLEKKFRTGMSWRNYGKWHIDHIAPLASFDLRIPAEQRKAFHYTNMQPLWAQENRRKAASA